MKEMTLLFDVAEMSVYTRDHKEANYVLSKDVFI